MAGTEFKSYKAAQFAANRQGYFHYVLLPHRYDTSSASSGQAELPGDDMIVSLFCYGSDQYVANTVMHELGHNLNLSHGGGDNINHKPNYNSVMNYDYQFSGVDNNCTPAGDGVLDFSRGLNAPLDEAHLDERDGICGGVPWDWNGNGSFEAQVAQDINGGDGQFYTLNDHNDWANLLFLGAGSLSNNGTRSMLQIDIISDPPLPSWVTNTGPVNQ